MIDLKGYEGRYMIDPVEGVFSVTSNKFLKHQIGPGGYIKMNISKTKGGKQETFNLHSKLAEHFCDNPDNKPCVDHRDGNKLNNRIDNLRFLTNSENVHNQTNVKGYYKLKNGKFAPHIKVDSVTHHLGSYALESDARLAYQAGSEKYFPGVKDFSIPYM